MRIISLNKLITSFEEIVGWPYVSPGTNDIKGIDCSGAFVRAYRIQGSSIYHGSNTIYRSHCSSVGKISSASSLQPGMPVFKNRQDGNEPSKFRNDGIGNMYHIGLVISVNPLRIIHATPPVAKIDTSLGNWAYWGKLKEVPYDSSESSTYEEPTKENPQQGTTGSYKAIVSVSSVNLRKEMDTKSYRVDVLPQGTILTVYGEKNGWASVVVGANYGYVMTEFIKRYDDNDNNPIEDTTTPPHVIPSSSKAIVVATSGNTVKLRNKPSSSERLYWDVPIGAEVEILGESINGWNNIEWNGKRGYMMSNFLQIVESI